MTQQYDPLLARHLEGLALKMEHYAGTRMDQLTHRQASRFHKATEIIRQIADEVAERRATMDLPGPDASAQDGIHWHDKIIREPST